MQIRCRRAIVWILAAALAGAVLPASTDAQDRGGRLQQIFERVDRNDDDVLTPDEVRPFPRLHKLFEAADADGNQQVTLRELQVEALQRMRKRGRTPQGESPGDTAGADAPTTTRTVTVNGRTRRYEMHVPRTVDPDAPNPVVLAFHGGGGNPESMMRLSRLNRKADEEGFIAVYPYGSGPRKDRFLSWNGGNCCAYAQRQDVDDVAFVRALLDDLSATVSVDSNRVYATGISNGGILTYRLAEALSPQIAAIAPVAATMGHKTAAPDEPVPILHFHGTSDELIPFEGGFGKRPRGGKGETDFLSVSHTMQVWTEANGCAPDPQVESLPNEADDGTRVVRKTWSGCDAGSKVVLMKIEGGGHTWPGRPAPREFLGTPTEDISANDAMWRFFQKHAQGPPVPLRAASVVSESPSETQAYRPVDTTGASGIAPVPGRRKPLSNGDASRDAAGTGQLFESVHVPGLTDFHEGLNGFALSDLDGNGYLDVVTVNTEPFALNERWDDISGEVERTRNPEDRLRVLLNQGGFRLKAQDLTLTGSPATPQDFSQGWRGAQVPAVADFNDDGREDLFVTRQAPMKAGRMIPGEKPVGNSLFLAGDSLGHFRDVSAEYGIRNERAYNRAVSLGDVNLDGFIDVAVGADNVFNAFNGLPRSALYVFQPNSGAFKGGRFKDVGGTDTIPDFGGFYHDSDRDKAGPIVSLRDVDNDADLDVLQSTHVMLPPDWPRLTAYSPGEYRHGVFNWRNLLAETGRFRFETVTGNGFASEARFRFDADRRRFVPAGDSTAPALPYLFFGDVDNDARLDAIGFRLTRFATDPTVARFWYNEGDYQFRHATDEAGLSRLRDSYKAWYDFFGADPPDIDGPLTSRERWRLIGTKPGQSRLESPPQYADAAFADFDNDGWLDLVVVDRLVHQKVETRSFLFMNQGDGTFEAKSTTFSGLDATGLSVEAADLNNDGLVDLVIGADPDNTGQATTLDAYESIVYKNTGRHGARDNHWLRLRFSGVSDAELLGAHVTAHPTGEGEGVLGMRGLYNNRSYRSHHPLQAHFGLADRSAVDVQVRLVGGRTVTFEDVQANQFVDADLSTGRVAPVEARASFPASTFPSSAK